MSQSTRAGLAVGMLLTLTITACYTNTHPRAGSGSVLVDRTVSSPAGSAEADLTLAVEAR
jgi:hypothetical protein